MKTILEENEKYFIVNIDKKKVTFQFRPDRQMQEILDEYNVKYSCTIDRDKLPKSNKLKPTTNALFKYTIYLKSKDRHTVIMMLSDIFDYIVEYYKIDCIKERCNII